MLGWRAWRLLCMAGALLADPARALAQSAESMFEVAPPASFLSGGFRPEQALYYAGFDIWRFGYAGYAGAEWSPASYGQDGPLIRMTSSDGIDIYQTRLATYRTETASASLLAGWRVHRGAVEFKALAGLDAQARILLNPYLAWIERPTIGMKFAAELWWEPTDATMVAASLSATTATAARNGRLAYGWRLFDRFWAGPEVAASTDLFTTQYRLGAHITGVRIEDTEWTAAAGYVMDSYNRTGFYGRIGISLKQGGEREGMLLSP